MLWQLLKFARGSRNAQWHRRAETSPGEEVWGEHVSLAVGETFQNPQSAVLAPVALGKGSHDVWGWPDV